MNNPANLWDRIAIVVCKVFVLMAVIVFLNAIMKWLGFTTESRAYLLFGIGGYLGYRFGRF